MGEIIEHLSIYFFYGMGVFVVLYWLFFIPKDEKIKNIKNTKDRFTEVFGKNKKSERKDQKK